MKIYEFFTLVTNNFNRRDWKHQAGPIIFFWFKKNPIQKLEITIVEYFIIDFILVYITLRFDHATSYCRVYSETQNSIQFVFRVLISHFSSH